MKKRLLVTGFVAIAVSTPAYALFPYITQLPISELQCNINRGSNTYSFVAHWGVLVDLKAPHPRLVDPKTGKYWPTYMVQLKSVGAQCTVANGGVVNCGGAATCSIVVTCPLKGDRHRSTRARHGHWQHAGVDRRRAQAGRLHLKLFSGVPP